jgi:hypothetical protein
MARSVARSLLRDRDMRRAPLVQGLFYVATGLWPILHYRSFERVTGAKRDDWLVKTTGALIAVVGIALVAERSRLLGIGSAVALGLADVVYAANGRISRIYLADAAVEAGVVASWL